MKRYRHLTQRERFIIQDLRDLGKNFTEIAKEVGVHRTTISREIERNSNQKGGYRALGAHEKSKLMRPSPLDVQRKISGSLQELIEEKLESGWSPEQISGRLKLEGSFSISHESIYRWIYSVSPGHRVCLRVRGRRRRRGLKKRRRGLGGTPRKQISERSKIANSRTKIGHWERDLVEGKRSGPSLLVAVDRYSRYTKIEKVYSHSSAEVNEATLRILKNEAKTVTNDNGVEFGNAEALEKKLNAPIYYCTPYTSWQRGTVENTNGLIRQFYPKHFDFWKTNDSEIKDIELSLNHRPRKVLNYKTPFEVHFQQKKKLINSVSTYKRNHQRRRVQNEKAFWQNYWKEYFR